jgi:hypothetical protein
MACLIAYASHTANAIAATTMSSTTPAGNTLRSLGGLLA